ncbi:MAG: 4-(cytidine 5'-diphospho)-2-C-methyl-D-erythritol kinase [Clostridia bacterium]|nr:4-(cytidine 5'-diphospho)-2-C-methyl-D-erythritol kinase [Clostridia bacterium]
MTVTKKAYAKINLTLEILGTKRGDGFHDIASVMMKVSDLYDTVTVTQTQSGITLVCDKDVCAPEENLAYKAAQKCIALCGEKYGKSMGVSIDLKKSIPMGAGLAGGSSDAAALIDAVSELCGGFTDEEKHGIAASLGSDIPFCLECHKVALCKGRGEIITDLADIKDVEIKVIMPKTPLFTKGIYAEYDSENGDDYTKDKSIRMAELINKGAGVSELAPLMCNDFQSICEKRCPEIKEAAESLKKEGFCSQMSGSGSAVFGIKKA